MKLEIEKKKIHETGTKTNIKKLEKKL